MINTPEQLQLATKETLLERYSILYDQLKALQDAVMALDPFHGQFANDHGICYGCYEVQRIGMIHHNADCQVTKLREMLKNQGIDNANTN